MAFKRGDLVTNGYVQGYYVCARGSDPEDCIIERLDTEGWTRNGVNKELIPKDYIHIKYDSFWAVSRVWLVKKVLEYEIY